MDILDDTGVSKLSAKVNYSLCRKSAALNTVSQKPIFFATRVFMQLCAENQVF